MHKRDTSKAAAHGFPTLNPGRKQEILKDLVHGGRRYFFFHVNPAESGMERAIWVSQDPDTLAFVVCPSPAPKLGPRCKVFGLGEDTPFADVNIWLHFNRLLLREVAENTKDVQEFYGEMKRVGMPDR